jgi:tricorn protease
MTSSWIRFPAVHGDRLVFVTDDDVFTAPLAGGIARRLTSGAGAALRPRLSPDGVRLTFDSTAEGVRDVWCCDAGGGPVTRLTWGGATNLGFDPAGRPLVSTAHDQPFVRSTHAAVVTDGSRLERVPFGPVAGVAGAPSGRVVVVRHATELGTWRRYRGGRLGVAWLGVPRGPAGDWQTATFAWRKVELPGAAAFPTWCADRFWFVGDPGAAPELCSVDEAGADFRVHTSLGGFGVRHPHSDGRTLVFVHDGGLWRWTPEGPAQIEVDVHAQRTDRQRRLWPAARFVEEVDLHPDGHSIAVAARGRVFAMGFWEGPVRARGGQDGVRHLLPRWVDAQRLATVTDRDGEYRVEVSGPGAELRRFPGDHGRPVSMEVSPAGDRLVFADHSHHLLLLDLATGQWTELDHAPPGGFEFDWSSDGAWLAWSRPVGQRRSKIRLREIATGATVDVTDGGWRDRCPSFDPDGNHLYFLSLRDFDPVSDTVSFGYAFARGTRPYCVTLRRDVPHPFRPQPRPLKAPPAPRASDRGPVVIEVAGLSQRVVPFPVAESRWGRVIGVGGGQVLLTREPVRGMLDRSWADDGPPQSEATLCLWEADKQELVELTTKVGALRVDRRREQIVWRSGWRLRVAMARPEKSARDELKKTEGRADRKTGWLDVGRIRDEVDPELEWPQMVRDAHRLMRDHFWQSPSAALLSAGAAARDAALALLPRIGTRAELSDLLLSVAGVWGTSHAYELGGDLPAVPSRRVGWLGADVSWEPVLGGYRVDRVLAGDVGTERSSPLLAPGAGVEAGEVIVAVDGRRVAPERPLAAWLVDRAQVPVELELGRPEDGATRTAIVVPLASERDLRYRDWVQQRRELASARSAGRVGYLHVPNMGPVGFAEFHRDLHEAVEHEALLVDVRHNGGGHVSSLLLRTLAQRRLGRSDPRHGGGHGYPLDAPPPYMALLANESAGSDGDIFTHAWKRLGLGTVFGTRTWGGVVGISPRLRLVDRTLTTQPEYATWFDDVGYGLENRGVDPDVEVESSPDVAATDEDPALELAVVHLVGRLDREEVGLGDATPVR